MYQQHRADGMTEKTGRFQEAAGDRWQETIGSLQCAIRPAQDALAPCIALHFIRSTVAKFWIDAGKACAAYHDANDRNINDLQSPSIAFMQRRL